MRDGGHRRRDEMKEENNLLLSDGGLNRIHKVSIENDFITEKEKKTRRKKSASSQFKIASSNEYHIGEANEIVIAKENNKKSTKFSSFKSGKTNIRAMFSRFVRNNKRHERELRYTYALGETCVSWGLIDNSYLSLCSKAYYINLCQKPQKRLIKYTQNMLYSHRKI